MEAYRCAHCSALYPIRNHPWRCQCTGPLEVQERLPFQPALIHRQRHTLWRYQAMIPPEARAGPVSLGEGFTPIIPLSLQDVQISCKLEFLAPTGSFKDRGTTVLVSALRAWGVRGVVDDSSGNAGASLAAYCAHAGIRCRIYVPAQASGAKLAQIQAYGAELIPIKGPRENCARAAQEAAQENYYASHVHHPLILEGMKTFAYELWEQLDGHAPDAIVFPTGQGTFLLGTYLGLRDLQQAGVLSTMPQLIAVQSAQCAPLHSALEQGLDDVPLELDSSHTIAEGIRIVRPVRTRALLEAIRKTHGETLIVRDEEIRQAQQMLARCGLYVEPTSAVAVAGVLRWKERPQGTIVLPLTGSGLKATPP
jgi:threonine synthase